MFRVALAAVSLFAVTATVPAAAATFNDSTSFTTVQGAGGFTYGSFDGTSFTAFDSNTNCVIGNITCLRSSSVALPSAFKADGSAATNGSVILTPGVVIVHPGETNLSAYVAWTAPGAFTYTGTLKFTQQDTGNGNTPHSVGVTEFYTPLGGATVFGTRFVVDNVTQPVVYTGFASAFAAGDTVGYIVDKDGVYYNDSTGIGFTVAGSVPEPMSWALMVVGFGLVGFGMRRRTAALAA